MRLAALFPFASQWPVSIFWLSPQQFGFKAHMKLCPPPRSPAVTTPRPEAPLAGPRASTAQFNSTSFIPFINFTEIRRKAPPLLFYFKRPCCQCTLLPHYRLGLDLGPRWSARRLNASPLGLLFSLTPIQTLSLFTLLLPLSSSSSLQHYVTDGAHSCHVI